MSYDYSTGRVEIVPFTASFTLRNEDIGKAFRYEGATNASVTVPNDLHSGFSCGFIQYSTGTITIVSGAHATKVAGGSATNAQYQSGSLIVTKRSGGNFGVVADIDYLVGGDFS
ncbi:hypothetical protein [Bradyrhizobium arachidis]|uniref:Uncharacterized protein n=1 Tax=Bradyrhizobium arachidis TaxID=858423 RepID=A0AAE7NPF3_9BRAD|nr:hypothetical protein [Bradyrhizobium arachidis]QOZ69192.1 hypothetical protein WN72_24855 [Bradyrhizobium arachidis]SFV11282.1 hypothetical protein SAMN05192541_1175 [Bradyrhizobium arachidis]